MQNSHRRAEIDVPFYWLTFHAMIQQETQWTEGLPRVSSLQQRLSTAAAMARQRLRRRGQLRRAREGDRARRQFKR